METEKNSYTPKKSIVAHDGVAHIHIDDVVEILQDRDYLKDKLDIIASGTLPDQNVVNVAATMYAREAVDVYNKILRGQ